MNDLRKRLRGATWKPPTRRDACQCTDSCFSSACDAPASTAWPLWYWPRRLLCAIVGHSPAGLYSEPEKGCFCTRCRSTAKLLYNPMATDEDFWIPIGLPGQPPIISEEDEQYFRKRLMEALMVPPEYIKKS